MNKREREETCSRNFWDSVHADNLMKVIKRLNSDDLWRDDMMEAHLHLVWHFAHDENDRLDFYAKHRIGGMAHPSGRQAATH